MADCYTLMGRHLYLPSREAFEKARGYAYRALELNDKLAEAHTALAAVLMIYNWDWDLAEEQFKQAIQLNPNYANAHYLHSVLSNPTIFITVYSILGDQDNAFLWAEKALEAGKIAFPSLRFSPDLKRFRTDPRYKSLLAKADL